MWVIKCSSGVANQLFYKEMQRISSIRQIFTEIEQMTTARTTRMLNFAMGSTRSVIIHGLKASQYIMFKEVLHT
jgi:hypothetical protein